MLIIIITVIIKFIALNFLKFLVISKFILNLEYYFIKLFVINYLVIFIIKEKFRAKTQHFFSNFLNGHFLFKYMKLFQNVLFSH